MGIGKLRNLVCSCGSGKKFKRCHYVMMQGFKKNNKGIWERKEIIIDDEGNSHDTYYHWWI